MVVANTLAGMYAGTTPLVKLYAGTQPVWSATKVDAALVLPGVALNYLSATPVVLPGDVEILARLAPVNWTPGPNTSYAGILARYGVSGTRSFAFRIRLDGLLSFVGSVDGTNLHTGTNTSTVAVPFAGTNTPGWVRVTYVIATGVATYYTAADSTTIPSTWTALGTTRTLTPTGALFNPAVTTRWQIGDVTTATANPFTGRVYRMILRDGIGGTALLDVNEDNANASVPTSFTATTGGTVTATVTAGNQIIQVRPAAIPPVAAKLVFPGVVGNYMTTPDIAALRVTGDLEVVVRMTPVAWFPTANLEMIGRYTTAGGRSWRLLVTSTGKLQLICSLDGTATTSPASSVTMPNDALPRWIKATRVASTGNCQFWYADDATTEPTTWTKLGADVASTAGNLFAGTSPLSIGQLLLGNTGPYSGRLYRAIIRSGIAGTTIFDVNEDNADANVPSQLTPTVGQVVSTVVTAGNQIIQPRVP